MQKEVSKMYDKKENLNLKIIKTAQKQFESGIKQFFNK